MKINMQIICENKDEFDRAEQAICNIIESIRYDDVIHADIVIGSEEEGTDDAEK